MRRLVLILFTVLNSFLNGTAQEVSPLAEQQLENLTDASQSDIEDDSYLQQLEQFRKNPVNLNKAGDDELKDLHLLSGLQIASFISYRKLLGEIIDKYELQAIPLWDLNTIRKLLPFITIGSPVSIKEDFSDRIKKGEHSLVFRISQILEKSKGFDRSISGSNYLGSPQRIFLRYRYAYKNLLQFGITGDKDAGEQFLKGAQNKGFDFYSFHLFARQLGIIKAIAIGDFAVNMGQGLIQWQSMAFNKSADIINSKRQSAVLQPYNSAGEFNFYRGIGITINKRRMEITGFVSSRRISANLATDTLTGEEVVSSFLISGYNRTAAEMANRNNLHQTVMGGNIKYNGRYWHIGLNGVYYRFSSVIDKRDAPYNLYAVNGNNWGNLSADYSYTFKNLHFFGETAVDKNFHKAIVNGLLASVDPKIDLSVLHRRIDKEYQAINGDAFTENTTPSNEEGIYAGITFRPMDTWRLDAYADLYRFPWLKYLVDAPSYGRDFLFQLTYMPGKYAEVYMKYRNEIKEQNQPPGSGVMSQTGIATTNTLVQLPRQDWRIQVNYKVNTAISIRNRMEMVWYDKKGRNSESGFLALFDLIYGPLLRQYSCALRLQYFETDGYNSRLYAYENDVLYSYSIPVFFGKGYRYYLLLNYTFTKNFSLWLKWSQTIYRDKNSIGSGLDEISGNKKSEIKIQARYLF